MSSSFPRLASLKLSELKELFLHNKDKHDLVITSKSTKKGILSQLEEHYEVSGDSYVKRRREGSAVIEGSVSACADEQAAKRSKSTANSHMPKEKATKASPSSESPPVQVNVPRVAPGSSESKRVVASPASEPTLKPAAKPSLPTLPNLPVKKEVLPPMTQSTPASKPSGDKLFMKLFMPGARR